MRKENTMRRMLLVLGFSAALAACDSAVVFEPELVQHHEISPPDVFRTTWWTEISRCSGKRGDFNKIHWFQVESDEIPYVQDGEPANAVGMWQKPHNIYLAGIVFKMMSYGEWTDSYQKWSRIFVEHEMLHELIRTGDHSPIFEKCGVGRADVEKSVQALLDFEGITVRR